jgi:DNA invertase Pin-like site-specific DNA recombinase
MAVYGYTRKSTTDDRQDNSHERQRRAIKAWAEAQGTPTVAFTAEEGSAYRTTDGRARLPERERLLSELRDGDVLVIAELSRVARSVEDGSRIIRLAGDRGWRLVILNMANGEALDTGTATGKLLANVVLAVAEFESALTAERIRSGIRRAKEDGRHVGRPRTIPTRVRLRIVEERAAGRSYGEIADGLNRDRVKTAAGGKQWYPVTARKVCEQEGAA